MYELIGHQRLESAASSITFSNIPQTWTDLYLVVSLRKSDGENYFGLQFNGSQANTSSRMLIGTGSTTASYAYSQANKYNIFGYPNSSTETAATFGNASVYISNYTSASAKSVSLDSVSENNGTSAIQQLQAGLWNSTAAITSLSLVGVNSSLDAGGTFAAGSSATLYGINRTQAIGKPKAIGGNITYANGYWVHTFTGSGTFYAQQDLQLEYLVVGGGGGGGSYQGGGGAGGYRAAISGELSGANSAGERPIAISARSFIPVIVGASGAGAVANGRGSNGSDSSIGSIIAFGGGGGGGRITTSSINSGASGGSGGGSGFQGSVGAGTANQGFAGGTFNNVTAEPGGGGGGAASVGGNASGSTAGNGGAGITSYATGSAVARAGGGGGGAYGTVGGVAGSGGIGGGGNGSSSSTGGAGTANTGGGGGGAGASPGNPGIGGNGGSGVVIIRYPA